MEITRDGIAERKAELEVASSSAQRNSRSASSFGLVLFESPASIPEQVANSVRQVIKEREAPTDEQQAPDHCRHHCPELLVLGLAGGCANEPGSQHQQADSHRHTGRPVQDRKGHRDRPAVDRQVR